MNLLLMDLKDDEGCLVNLALRAEAAGHAVRYWLDGSHPTGNGMLTKVKDYEPSMKWADLIVPSGNCDYPPGMNRYIDKGYPVFGTNKEVAELELDRALGQKVFEKHNIEVVPYKTVETIDEAIKLVKKTRKAYAIKPWGGEADKAMTCVARDADEAIFMLSRWKAQGLEGHLMLQEKIDGVEMGIAGWFGPGGWSRYFEESFEHKKFLNGDLGSNTGEMGTVIRHVEDSPLVDQLLTPLTDYLAQRGFVGDCNVNCIIDESGTPLPLEFTLRLGWPDFNIRQAVVVGDPVEWMADLLRGKDTLGVSTKAVVGVVLTHGDFPLDEDPVEDWAGFPVRGVTAENVESLHFQQVQEGQYPSAEGPKTGLLSAGNYLMVVSGVGSSVSEAAAAAYKVAEQIKLPSNLMYRTDIGDRLEDELPRLHKLGYAEGLRYE